MRDIYRRRELLGILVSRNLKIRYKSSALGFFWSLLLPLFMILIYAVFARLLRFTGGQVNYLQFLVVGIVVWQFLTMCVNDSLTAILGNSNLVKKTAFPRIVLPLSMVAANLVNFFLTAVVLVVYLLATGIPFHNLVWLPAIVLTQCALCLGLALILSAANVYFRDTEHIIHILALGWFFLTPIFYPVRSQTWFLPGTLQWLVYLNPMTGIVCLYRNVFMSMALTSVPAVAVSVAMSWIILAIGVAVFQKAQVRFADEL